MYRRRVLRDGKTHKERVVKEMRESFKTHLEESPASHVAIVKNKSYKALMADRRFADEELNGKYMAVEWENQFSVGDYVEVLGATWFIDLVEEETVETKRSYRLMPCNNTLKWQDEKGQIYEFPCHLVDKTSVYSDGLSKGSLITTSTYQAQVLIPFNKYVAMIDTNDRFIFNHTKHNIYYVTRIDMLTRKGLVFLVMKYDELVREFDDLENNLSKPIGANARIDTNIVTPENPIDKIEYTVHEIIGSHKINIRQKNVEYSMPTATDVSWEIIGTNATITENGNKVYLTPTGTYGDVILRATFNGEVLEKIINIGFM